MRRTFFGLVHTRQSQSRFEERKIATLVVSRVSYTSCVALGRRLRGQSQIKKGVGARENLMDYTVKWTSARGGYGDRDIIARTPARGQKGFSAAQEARQLELSRVVYPFAHVGWKKRTTPLDTESAVAALRLPPFTTIWRCVLLQRYSTGCS
jgi:hypothetical protein